MNFICNVCFEAAMKIDQYANVSTQSVTDGIGFVTYEIPGYPVLLVLHRCLDNVEGMLALTHYVSGYAAIQGFYSPFYDSVSQSWSPGKLTNDVILAEISAGLDIYKKRIQKHTHKQLINKFESHQRINNPSSIYLQLGLPLSPECDGSSYYNGLTLLDVKF